MPTIPPNAMFSSLAGGSGNALAPPTNPANFLIAAAGIHQNGEFQSAPVPAGTPLQVSKKGSRKAPPLKVLK